MTFKTQEEKDEAVTAQKKVVDEAVGQPAVDEAKDKLEEIKAEEVE